MKKQILFITQYLHTGGIEKSLLNLLSNMDYSKYDVDLLLFDHSGVLFNMIPQQVNILPPLFDHFSTPLPSAIPILFKKKRYRLINAKVLAAFFGKVSKGMGTGARWLVYRNLLEIQKKKYDIAVSYIDLFCNYYVIEKVKAKKKILYNHMDYDYSLKSGWPCPRLDKQSFLKSDCIVSVAESSKKSLEFHFPEVAHKIKVIHNTVSPKAIFELANKDIAIEMLGYQGLKIVTVARLVEEKGVKLAIETARILKDQGIQFKWFLIGIGSLKDELIVKIKETELTSSFILLGERANPYPYMSECDLYVQPSKTEAHCVAVEEAMALHKPIVVTDIPAFRSQIENGKTGMLVTATPQGIADGIITISTSDDIMDKYSTNLKRLKERMIGEIEKFNELLTV